MHWALQWTVLRQLLFLLLLWYVGALMLCCSTFLKWNINICQGQTHFLCFSNSLVWLQILDARFDWVRCATIVVLRNTHKNSGWISIINLNATPSYYSILIYCQGGTAIHHNGARILENKFIHYWVWNPIIWAKMNKNYNTDTHVLCIADFYNSKYHIHYWYHCSICIFNVTSFTHIVILCFSKWFKSFIHLLRSLVTTLTDNCVTDIFFYSCIKHNELKLYEFIHFNYVVIIYMIPYYIKELNYVIMLHLDMVNLNKLQTELRIFYLLE